MAWTPRLPYLTPMGFFVWSHIKPLVYTSPVDSEDDLIVRIFEAATTIRQQPGIFERASHSLLRSLSAMC